MRVSGEGFLYSLLLQGPRMDLPSQYRGIRISKNTGNEKGQINGDDWQPQAAKDQAPWESFPMWRNWSLTLRIMETHWEVFGRKAT